MHFLLWTKGSLENTNFDIFKCPDENLSNSSRRFPNHRSVFLQILHDSSVSWNIRLCTFLGQAFYTLPKGTNQSENFLDFLVLESKFTNFLSFLKQKVSFSSNAAPFFCIMRHSSTILSVAETLYTFSKSSLSK